MTVSAAALAIVGFVVNHTTCFDPEANHYEFSSAQADHSASYMNASLPRLLLTPSLHSVLVRAVGLLLRVGL